MATPEVKVKISADKSGLDSGVAGAKSSLAGFASSFPLIGAAVAAAGVAIGAFAKSAVDEAGKAETGMVRLGVAVKNSGNNFTALSPVIEATVTKFTRLTTATDDDLREALTRMITVSGDTKGSLENLGVVTDLAAYKNISLSDAADIVGKAMNGNTTAFNKMGIAGKDATSVLENARASFGGFAEQQGKTFEGSLARIANQWGEFKEAVGTAVLSGGEASAMADGLAGVLAGLVGWVERNEESFILTFGAVRDFGAALFGVATSIYSTIQPALGPVLKVTFGVLLGLLNTATFGVRGLTSAFQLMAGTTIKALGQLVEKGGGLLKLFGVKVVSEAGTSMRQFGDGLVTSAKQSIADATTTYGQGMKDLMAGRRLDNERTEGEEKRTQGAVTEIHKRGHDERLSKSEQAAQIHRENMRRANEIFEQVTKALEESTRPSLQGMKVDYQKIEVEVGKVKGTIDVAKSSQKELAGATKEVTDAQQEVNAAAEAARRKFEENVDTAESLGHSLLDAASGMGLVSKEAASALGSVINMGASIAKFGLGSPEGLLAIIGGLANLVGGWGSSAAEQARKASLASNTRAIEELTRDLSDYNGAASGRTFSGVTTALEGVFGEGPGRFLGTAELAGALRGVGLTVADARKLAEKYGIDVDGDQLGWFKLLQVLKTRKFGSGEGNFADELASIEDSFGVLGIDDADDQLGMFAKFVDKNIPALKGVLGDTSTEGGRVAAIAKLKDLYQRSITSKLSPADYGGATPQQFRKIIATLLPLLGAADGTLSGVAGAGTGASFAGAALASSAPGLGPTVAGFIEGLGGSSAVDAIGAVAGGIGGGDTYTVYVTQLPGENGEDFALRVAQILGAKYTLQREAQGYAA